LQKEIKQLKELLIKKDLDKLVMDSYLEVAAEKLGYKDVDELKKNLNIKPCEGGRKDKTHWAGKHRANLPVLQYAQGRLLQAQSSKTRKRNN